MKGRNREVTKIRFFVTTPNSKFNGAYMGPTWGRQDPGGPCVSLMNLAIRGRIDIITAIMLNIVSNNIYPGKLFVMSFRWVIYNIFPSITDTYSMYHYTCHLVNSSPRGQNGLHFADDSFKRIFMNEKCLISIQISLKFVPEGPIDNKAALFR